MIYTGYVSTLLPSSPLCLKPSRTSDLDGFYHISCDGKRDDSGIELDWRWCLEHV